MEVFEGKTWISGEGLIDTCVGVAEGKIVAGKKILKGDKVLISSNSPEQYPPIEIGKIASVKKDGGFLDMDLDGLIEPRNIKFLTIVSND